MGSVGHRHREGSMDMTGREIERKRSNRESFLDFLKRKEREAETRVSVEVPEVEEKKEETPVPVVIPEVKGETKEEVVLEAEKEVSEQVPEEVLSVPEIGDGADPLKDRRKESYCQKIIRGSDPLVAFWESYYDEEGLERVSKKTAMTLRPRMANKEEVIRRIDWLNKHSEAASKITKFEKMNMIDALLKKTYEKAMGERSSANDVRAFLDVSARHDIATGAVGKPKVEIVFPQLDNLFSVSAMKAVEKKLNIRKLEENNVVDVK